MNTTMQSEILQKRRSSSEVSRRTFLRVVSVNAGALCIGIGLADEAAAATNAPKANAKSTPLSAFVEIAPNDVVKVIIPAAEMGQGVASALSMVLAEELDCDWKKVTFDFAPADAKYKNLIFGIQATGGSTTVRSFWEPMAKAGAAARFMLVSAAAKQWGVQPSSLTVRDGVVIHQASGRRLRYGQLVAEAAKITPPEAPTLKSADQRKLVGKRVRRLDTPAKVTGKSVYAMDVQLPGLLVASIALPPVFGSKQKGYDESKALAIPGVQKVVPFSNGVAVLAKDFWTAKKGRDALAETIQWEASNFRTINSAGLREQMVAAAKSPGIKASAIGDAEKALSASGAKLVEADYHVPYIAHACMEPMNATAWVRPDLVELWAPTQLQFFNADQCAKIGGVKPEQVRVYTTMLGGGFGRRFGLDFVQYALEVSKGAGVPVRLVFTREDDMRAHFYRPAQFTKLRAAVNADGSIQAMHARLVNSSVSAAAGFPLDDKGLDAFAVEGINGTPYEMPNLTVEWVRHEPGTLVWFWRSVGHSQNGFIMESFIDELAVAAGQDPVQYRLNHLKNKPRHAAVLRAAAEKAGWGKPLAQGRAMGVALHESFETIVANVVEISIENGQIKVHRVTSAVDGGSYISPSTVEAQVESSIATGLAQTLYMKITFKDGQVEQSNFHDHNVLRLAEMPKVDVVLIESGAKPGGMGEPATPPVAPAVANAMAKLTGRRQRELPLQV
ncbi:MAG TPA: molybdopterin cofactor-binding domain-containing protein [Burkholderiaceae bacterium]|nr:molybdopterin cofactor-binding domain-containing protein [Burkholderiaceae bacterium]